MVMLLSGGGGRILVSCQLSTFVYNRHAHYSLIYGCGNDIEIVPLRFQVLTKLRGVSRLALVMTKTGADINDVSTRRW